MHDLADSKAKEEEKLSFASAMISIIPKIDVLFTEVTLIASVYSSKSYCTAADEGLALSIPLTAIFVVLGIFFSYSL